MSASPSSAGARKPSGVRVMIPPGEQPPVPALSSYTNSGKANGASKTNPTSVLNAEREVELLNHCFDDVERFMSRLQQTAEAQSVLDQRKKNRNRKSKKEYNLDEDLLTLKAFPPSEKEFVDIFQKIKYSLCLLHRLKSSISQPDAPQLLHHVFVPLKLMVRTTGGPALGASVVSPAMTSGAVSFLREHLTGQEKEIWTSLGPNWTSSRSELSVSVPPYSPVFLDGWQPRVHESSGQPLEDPIESEHKQDAFREIAKAQTSQQSSDITAEVDGNGLPPGSERLYCCSYDFVARNSSELSVLQGETLEVIESSKRWWKCRNRFDQIGFIPFNILEPLTAVSESGRESSESKKTSNSTRTMSFSYAPSSPAAKSPPLRPQSMVLPSTPMRGDSDKVLIMNDELLQRLAGKRGSGRRLVVPRTAETTVPLNYHSPPVEVKAWLTAKGFSQQTIESLGILNGAQLFSLNKEELREVLPDEGARVYSQIMVQKSLLEDVHKATELETVMEKQKMKIDVKPESNVL
ncbi:epidermal growth factor receptor kinase substrate 8-like protein 1a [Channa argus]|uniref:epidermal growth factor receptor kinase substrate 8-like protein 1a n=1 Tax=Channa argus TaxID=215402 RepID=UPI0029464F84|nr:hypothetical protein Q8A73_016463 [Channa argus]